MTEFSKEPIEGEEAAGFRSMRHEWDEFSNDERPALKKVALVVNHWSAIWKFVALVFIIGFAGSFKSLLDYIKVIQ